jgi:lipopolysaccharide/colanic/teichoic acid biosynthesis glycosyltransferase
MGYARAPNTAMALAASHLPLMGRVAKRTLDIVAASAGLAALSVPFGLVALAIKMETPGPVFYRGERVGRHGKTFRIFKFRSMQMTDGTGPHTTSTDDERVTRIGKVIRHYKLDELSQLINVLLGDMSLVGPRPEVKWCVDLYTDEEKAILKVRPGITDWSSIKFHNEGEIIANSGFADPDQAYLTLVRPEKLRLQLKYVRECSLRIDLTILFETMRVLIQTRLSAS